MVGRVQGRPHQLRHGAVNDGEVVVPGGLGAQHPAQEEACRGHQRAAGLHHDLELSLTSDCLGQIRGARCLSLLPLLSVVHSQTSANVDYLDVFEVIIITGDHFLAVLVDCCEQRNISDGAAQMDVNTNDDHFSTSFQSLQNIQQIRLKNSKLGRFSSVQERMDVGRKCRIESDQNLKKKNKVT